MSNSILLIKKTRLKWRLRWPANINLVLIIHYILQGLKRIIVNVVRIKHQRGIAE